MLPGGIPAHDRVLGTLALVDPDELELIIRA